MFWEYKEAIFSHKKDHCQVHGTRNLVLDTVFVIGHYVVIDT